MQEILGGGSFLANSSTLASGSGLSHTHTSHVPSSPSRTSRERGRDHDHDRDRHSNHNQKSSTEDRRGVNAADVRLSTARESLILREHDASLRIVPERDPSHSTLYKQHYSGLEVGRYSI